MNLIITCPRHFEPETEDELIDILEEFGDSDAKITITNMSGILTAETKLDPIETVRKIKEMLLDEPWSVRYCLRIIPIQKVIETKIEEIEKEIPKKEIKEIEKKEEIRIGTTLDLSSKLSFIGKKILRGLHLRINQENKKDGIDGKKIKLI